MRCFSSRVKSTLRSGCGAGDAGLVPQGDQESWRPTAPLPRERGPRFVSWCHRLLPSTPQGGMWHRRSGLAKEMACEKSAHSDLSICVQTAQTRTGCSPISSQKFALPGSHLSTDF